VSDAPGAGLRAQAARTLVAVLVQGRSLKAELSRVITGFADQRDRALFEAICFMALRHMRRYRFVLDNWMPRPLRERDAEIGCLLLVGLAQIDALKPSPHAAVRATAEAARLLGRSAQVGLVNAVLRRALREPWPESSDLGIRYSYPDWMVKALQREWPDDAEAILRENNLPAPMWLCVNPHVSTREQYLARLKEEGVEAVMPAHPEEGLVLSTPRAPESLPGWNEGAIWVQDGAAQLAVEALGISPGMHVLDACAAPGGKCAQLAAALDGSGTLLAVDIDARRLRRVGASLTRLKLQHPNVHLLTADATQRFALPGDRKFDAILIDAPCSATGIIRRQPDIKWHRRPDDIDALVLLQSQLLDALWPRLAPGGRMLYATCSVLPAENSRQVEAFLARTPGARAKPLDARFGRERGPGRQRLPGEDGMDGFYYALIIRHD